MFTFKISNVPLKHCVQWNHLNHHIQSQLNTHSTSFGHNVLYTPSVPFRNTWHTTCLFFPETIRKTHRTLSKSRGHHPIAHLLVHLTPALSPASFGTWEPTSPLLPSFLKLPRYTLVAQKHIYWVDASTFIRLRICSNTTICVKRVHRMVGL